ncbi:protocatechuate 3,4-dioxygenase subunit alpha [Prauserella muralis]|uniref:Uncharacterized protein n=1 Tax=Prauserella muralis TaxID=588067 RepID=A0A2V4ATX4_9PSEU|nr:protocatechuate 3,4-dioxygenase subunit alpha [Prauserella muralis]PXY24703.1 hypothetical protein BAY60_19565 [Prauserella muralis]TWE27602.1 protocatechuate 3,4-dioxygenase alpha subunit [Prauserella muralis]
MSGVCSPSQTIGPLYGYALMFDGSNQTIEPDAAGAVRIIGSVVDGSGAAIAHPDAMVEIWQAEQWARARADESGEFEFIVRKPAVTRLPDGRKQAPHFTVAVFASGLLKQVVTRLYFPDEQAANADDPVLGYVPRGDRERLIAQAVPGGLRFDIHLQGAQESVFFAF